MMDRLQELVKAGDAARLPALLLVDNRMPILGAEGVLRELAELRAATEASAAGSAMPAALRGMQAIIITGDADGATKAHMTGLGAHAVLTKPLDADDLTHSIKLMQLPGSET
jgi:CheY-like chemotaxis protein